MNVILAPTGFDDALAPGAFILAQNFPNPFNPSTVIAFTLPRPAPMRLEVYDAAGRRIRTLASEHMSAGPRSVVWDGRDNAGRLVASGVYFCRLSAGDLRATKKMILLSDASRLTRTRLDRTICSRAFDLPTIISAGASRVGDGRWRRMGNRTSKSSNSRTSIVPPETIERRILLIRGAKVILDSDLAALYGVKTKRLNEQVRRNSDRFPRDFLFQLTPEEAIEVVANCDHLGNLKYSKTLPNVFTEHGVIMAASVLNTPRAVEMSVFVVRAFVRLRNLLTTHKELAEKLAELERKLASHDEQILAIVDAIKRLMAPVTPAERRRIGF
jgi:hypothetical protein